jgi:hypothetical protein
MCIIRLEPYASKPSMHTCIGMSIQDVACILLQRCTSAAGADRKPATCQIGRPATASDGQTGRETAQATPGNNNQGRIFRSEKPHYTWRRERYGNWDQRNQKRLEKRGSPPPPSAGGLLRRRQGELGSGEGKFWWQWLGASGVATRERDDPGGLGRWKI